MIRHSILVLLVVALLGSMSFCSKGTQKDNQDTGNTDDTSSNSVLGKQILLADPTIFYEKGIYYLYGTGTTNKGFQVFVSEDLKKWHLKEKLALDKKDVFGTEGFWAPQVFKYKGTYYMAYTANEQIAIARSQSPLGPFIQDEQKAISGREGYRNIDPFVFFNDDGKIYLYFVSVHEGNRLYVAELKEDLSDIKTNTIIPCINAVENPQEWENKENLKYGITEGPTVLKEGRRYYLFYSGNDFRSIHYAMGYAIAGSPLGPWIKYEGNPVLDRGLVQKNGTGHGDFFKDKDGQYYYVFHTHQSEEEVNPRKTAIIKGNWVEDQSESKIMKLDKDSFRYLKYVP